MFSSLLAWPVLLAAQNASHLSYVSAASQDSTSSQLITYVIQPVLTDTWESTVPNSVPDAHMTVSSATKLETVLTAMLQLITAVYLRLPKDALLIQDILTTKQLLAPAV